MKRNKKKRIIIGLAVTAIIIVALLGAFYIYTLNYYRADDSAQAIYEKADFIDGNAVFNAGTNDSKTGFIFYPGGKVEASAYAPLLKALSDEGITCILVEMPFNLAVFKINSADEIYEKFPGIENWYLGGHSLGGAMASSYVNKNSDKLMGLVLLGAYPINDSDIPTLAVYGTEDNGLDISKLEGVENRLELIGGNHAYFGNYGEQKGDGVASMTRDEQQELTVAAIIDFIKGSSE